MKFSINFSRTLVVLALCVPVLAKAQFVNLGINAGIGVGGFAASGLSAKVAPTPVFGAFLRYNWLERVSFQGTVNYEAHKFTLAEAKKYAPTPGGGNGTITSAPDFTVKHSRLNNHVMFAYSFLEGKLDLQAGAFYGIDFGRPKEYRDSETFFGTTDTELEAAFQTGTTGSLASATQIETTLDRFAGLSIGASGGGDTLRGLLRYDYGLRKKFADEAGQIRIKQNHITAGLIYIFK